MAEAIGLVSGSITIVKLFHTTVQIFDIVNTSKEYSADIHLLCSKLELERTRLLTWGELVGLSEIDRIGPQSAPDNRIYHSSYHGLIVHHLNRLLQLFEKVQRFLDKHGVRLEPDQEVEAMSESDVSTIMSRNSRTTMVRRPVQKVFSGQLATLRKSIQKHQTTVPWFKKAKWAVYQGDRFKKFVEEIRSLINGLHDILPDIGARTRERLIEEIEVSEDISSLNDVQAAAHGYHDDLAKAASARSELLSITISTQTMSMDEVSVVSNRGPGRSAQAIDPFSLSSPEVIISQYTKGAVSFHSSRNESRLLSCQSRWAGLSEDLPDHDRGYLPLQCSSFGIYFAPSFVCIMDYPEVEAFRCNLGSVPGSISVAGYVEETRRHFGPVRHWRNGPSRLTPNVNRHMATEESLYNRIFELKNNDFPLNEDPLRDAELLQEVLGDKSLYGRSNGPYHPDEQIEDLKSYLNNRRNCLDFGSVVSALTAVLGDENGRGLGNFLSQVILSKELSRRLDMRKETIQSPFLANSIMISDRFLEGATLVAFDQSSTGRSKPLQELDLRLQCDWPDRQIDGLVQFAVMLKWPYLQTARTNIEDVPLKLSFGEDVGPSTADWIYGTCLPGKWASAHAMSALVECTPDLSVDCFPFFDGGLSLKNVSYWRTTSVLGKVLSGRATRSAMGWIGPCPAVNIPATIGFLHAGSRKIGPQMLSRPIEIQTEDLNELRDSAHWFVPQPPAPLPVHCRVSSIKIAPSYQSSQAPARATVDISLDGIVNEFILYTCPYFITPPRCRFGPHKIHDSERRMYENVVDLINLKDFCLSGEDTVVINAQCEGGEVFARAWCSEIGQSAVVASETECCFACAVKCASSRGIGVRVLIWSSSI